MKKLLFVTILFLSIFTISINAININIVLKNSNDHIQRFAASELQKHLKMVFPDDEINIDLNSLNPSYTFYIGFHVNDLKDEVNYVIQDNKIYLFGQDKVNKKYSIPMYTSIDFRNKVGTLFAVYDFLYQELNFRWISPFENEIFYGQYNNLELKNKTYSWNSKYKFRRLRNDIWDWKKINRIQTKMISIPASLLFDEVYVDNRMQKDLLWKRRLKQELSQKSSYGHAFREYWDEYGKEHPEWFALADNGARGKYGFKKLAVDRQKFCVINQELQNKIVDNWSKSKSVDNIFNASINDSKGYCTCDACRALDVEKKSKSDRYVYFWNSLYEKISKHNSNAKLIAYAYSDYRYPPITNKLNKNIILGFVPQFKDSNKEILSDINGWKEKGLQTIFYRPNDFNDDIGLPMGHEKYIWERLNILKEFDIVGLDYDRNYNSYNLAYDGITKYVLMQSFNFPDKSFKQLENEYLETFQNAQEDIKKFYQYWRKNFEQKRLNVVDQYGGSRGRKAIYKNIDQFFSEDDFIKTQQILDDALLKVKDNAQLTQRIKNLQIANIHSKLLYEALRSKFDFNAHQKLLEYRVSHKDTLQLNWARLFESEYKYSNINYLKNKLNNIIDRF